MEIRYGIEDSHVLRYVLWSLWKYRCYWCTKPKEFTDIEIDHIVPKSISKSDLKEVAKALGLPSNYDLDDPMNLAPICPACNGPGGKGDHHQTNVPVVHTKLIKAQHLKPKVVAQVQSFQSNRRLAQSLLMVVEADISRGSARRLFEDQAPAIVQRLAGLGEDKADFLTYRTEAVQLVSGEMLDVRIILNSRGRTAVTLIEEVCSFPLNGFIKEPVIGLLCQVRQDTHVDFEAIRGPAGPTSAGPPMENFIDIDLDLVDFDGAHGEVEFTASGNFDASLSASLVQDSHDGADRNDFQGDAYVTGTFSFTASWGWKSGSRTIDVGECSIDSRDSDVSVTSY